MSVAKKIEEKESANLVDIRKLCEAAFLKKKDLEVIEEQKKLVNRELKSLNEKVLVEMESAEIEKLHIPGFGTISSKTNFSVKVPGGDHKIEFFDFLKSEGIFETMVTVNSATLNSWYQERMDDAIQQGDFDFSIPGIPEPKTYKTISFRKGK